jgi:hypothetical protein
MEDPMTIENPSAKRRQYVGDQMVQNRPSGEARKGVNVLNTSDPNHPAINPFVPVKNQTGSHNGDQGSIQSGQTANGNNDQSKDQSKE